jgi:hypothetical protein
VPPGIRIMPGDFIFASFSQALEGPSRFLLCMDAGAAHAASDGSTQARQHFC